MNVTLTGQQIQWLIDKFDLSVNLEEGSIVARRRDGHALKASTIAKMVGMKEAPPNWHERKDGSVGNL
jgi:hypothetical protein